MRRQFIVPGELENFLECIPADVAATDQDHDLPARVGVSLLQHRGERHASSALDELMLEVDELPHSVRDLRLTDEHELVDEAPAKAEGDRTLFYAARGTVRQCWRARFRDDPAGFDRVRHHGRCLGLAADDAYRRVRGLEHTGNPTDQTTATDGDECSFDIGQLPGGDT